MDSYPRLPLTESSLRLLDALTTDRSVNTESPPLEAAASPKIVPTSQTAAILSFVLDNSRAIGKDVWPLIQADVLRRCKNAGDSPRLVLISIRIAGFEDSLRDFEIAPAAATTQVLVGISSTSSSHGSNGILDSISSEIRHVNKCFNGVHVGAVDMFIYTNSKVACSREYAYGKLLHQIAESREKGFEFTFAYHSLESKKMARKLGITFRPHVLDPNHSTMRISYASKFHTLSATYLRGTRPSRAITIKNSELSDNNQGSRRSVTSTQKSISDVGNNSAKSSLCSILRLPPKFAHLARSPSGLNNRSSRLTLPNTPSKNRDKGRRAAVPPSLTKYGDTSIREKTPRVPKGKVLHRSRIGNVSNSSSHSSCSLLGDERTPRNIYRLGPGFITELPGTSSDSLSESSDSTESLLTSSQLDRVPTARDHLRPDRSARKRTENYRDAVSRSDGSFSLDWLKDA